MNKSIVLFCNFFILAWGSPLIPYTDIPTENYSSSSNASLYRLPNTTIPLSYNIVLTVDPSQARFQGQTTIRMRTQTNLKQVILHSHKLNITKTMVKTTLGASLPIFNTTHDDVLHFLTININSYLFENEDFDLVFEYEAPFGNLDGLYKSSYRASNGSTRYLAATQFQATHARQVFPCYDEPALKAVFNIHIYAPDGYESISNMDTIPSNQPPKPGYNVTSFRSSPLMSTYLVAFVVSDFTYKSNTRDGEIIYPREFRVYARPTAGDTVDYSLDFGQKSIQYLQAYIDTNYRLPKIDHVALPDFGAGAMENWGLITYREDYLLFYNEISTSNSKMITATIVSHENTHFWFGNEVSPMWWDYLWLSEGFATFFEFYITDKVYNGEWRLMEQFTVNEIQNAMIRDSLPSTNPMTNTVGTPDEIDRNFNTIAYSKSGAVIRMMQHILGESVFRLALSSYLKNLPTGVTEPQILFTEMQKVVSQTNILPENVTVAHIFGSWSDQAGYPVIEVSKASNNSLRIKQYRFYQNSSLTSDEKWWVPLTWATDGYIDFADTTTQAWMTPDDSEILLPIDAPTRWVIFNKQQSGYYRVMYSMEMWKDIIMVLNSDQHKFIHPLNKAQLIDDAATFSKTDRLIYNITFDILSYLKDEVDWYPWTSANRILSFLRTKMPASEKYSLYQKFLRTLSDKPYEEVGLTVSQIESYVQKRKRPLISRYACESGVKKCLSDAEDILFMSLVQGGSLDPDIKSVVYCYGLQRPLLLWEEVFKKYENTTSESEKSFIINGLGCSEKDENIDKYLSMTITNQTRLRNQDKLQAVRSVINAGPFGIGKVLIFLQNNFISLNNSLPSANDLANIINLLGSVISMDYHIELFDNFTMKYEKDFTPVQKTAVENARAAIDSVIVWRDTYLYDIDNWLFYNVPSGGYGIRGSVVLTIFYSFYVIIFKTVLK